MCAQNDLAAPRRVRSVVSKRLLALTSSGPAVTIARGTGGVAERLKAPVLKTATPPTTAAMALP
jgi:hypothetical protein